MEKLSLTCQCGQEMLVPPTAIGRSGLCPGCGAQIAITAENTHPFRPRKRPTGSGGGGLLALRRQSEARQENSHRESAWRNFAAAVDLYNSRRYAEALTLLNTLLQQFPGNPHVETARDQCLQALHRTTLSTHQYDGQAVDDGVLSPELVKSVVLDKLLNGTTEDVQLKAAEIAARLLGLGEPSAVGPAESEDVPGMPVQLDAGAMGGPQPESQDPANGHSGAGVAWVVNARRYMQETVAGNDGASSASQGEPPGQAKDAGIILPADWRMSPPKSSRFPGKTVFE